jgi:hypothetical protein
MAVLIFDFGPLTTIVTGKGDIYGIRHSTQHNTYFDNHQMTYGRACDTDISDLVRHQRRNPRCDYENVCFGLCDGEALQAL